MRFVGKIIILTSNDTEEKVVEKAIAALADMIPLEAIQPPQSPATSLIFNAKGNPFGQFLMVIFSILYRVISFAVAYYGEMITYLGMTAPMAVFALALCLKNRHNRNKAEVKEIIFMIILTAVITLIFYHILAAFHTANLIPSTIFVTTSFLAVYLTFRRSAFYAIGYAANDIV